MCNGVPEEITKWIKFVEEAESWRKAIETCGKLNGRLFENFTSTVDMQIILNEFSECVWLGIRSKAGENRWVSLQGVDFSLQVRDNWAILEPNDSQREPRAVMVIKPQIGKNLADVSLRFENKCRAICVVV